ncbi:hypothetical protein BD289DRAFT_436871 [Coniella lustricola]|uniref:Autophagy-related protein 28 n=1 Tax=Coniella lustricola TaxID=2025994 RepID=A0A2T3A4S8_9PEZI|nr:hypothetical protein BD289DRAFT_436871 [Coniella lustricola]
MSTTRSSFLPRLSLSNNGRDRSSILPTHHTSSTARYSTLRSNGSDYDLDELSPHPEDGLLPPDFRDPNSPQSRSQKRTNLTSAFSKTFNKRKPTGAINRRPSDSSSAGSASKTRHQYTGDERVLFSGPPPPIAMSTVLYRDEEQRSGGYDQYEDEDEGIERNSAAGLAASWLPGTARRAISSVIWDRSDTRSVQERGDRAGVVDRNSVWRSLARRERAVVADVQRFLQVQEESLAGANSGQGQKLGRLTDGRNGGGGRDSQSDSLLSDAGTITPTGSGAASMTLSRMPGRSVSFLEPIARSGPVGEVIPVRQPRQKKLGISGARRGIAHSLAELANLKTEEDASLLSALSTRKQALAKLRNLATRKDSIADELSALETDEAEPLGLELEELDNEHRGVCTEIKELEQRLAGLKSRRRHLEGRMNDVKNRREAGLSGYKNALKEVEDTVHGFLTRPPVKPLDVEVLAENLNISEEVPSPGGLEFMHLRPERRTIDMAREWWEAEIAILETRRTAVETEREALEAGIRVWDEVVDLVLNFEADLRKHMSRRDGSAPDSPPNIKSKGKQRELTAVDTLKLQYEKINGVIAALEQHLGAVEAKRWNLLIAAIGAELEAFKEAARVNREMLRAVGVVVDDDGLLKVPNAAAATAGTVSREDSNATTESHNSFHTTLGGGGSESITLPSEQLLDLPKNHEDERRSESDNEVPPELLAMHDDEDEHGVDKDEHVGESAERRSPTNASLDKEDSEDDVPHEFLVEHLGS